MALPRQLYALVSHNPQKSPARKPNIVELRAQKLREIETKKAIDRANEVLDQLERRVAHYDAADPGRAQRISAAARAAPGVCRAQDRSTARSHPHQTVGGESGSCRRVLPGIPIGRLSKGRPDRQPLSDPGRVHPSETGTGQGRHQTRFGARRGPRHSGGAFDAEMAIGSQMTLGVRVVRKSKYARRPRDHAYLEWIRGLPCLICGRRPVEAAHLATSSLWPKVFRPGHRTIVCLGSPHRTTLASSARQTLLGTPWPAPGYTNPRLESTVRHAAPGSALIEKVEVGPSISWLQQNWSNEQRPSAQGAHFAQTQESPGRGSPSRACVIGNRVRGRLS